MFAFPTTLINDSETPVRGFEGEVVPPFGSTTYPGLSIRDYFAARAMEVFLTLSYRQFMEDDTDEPVLTIAEVSDWAYKTADAMLEVRNAKG